MTVTIKMNRVSAPVKTTEEPIDITRAAATLWGEGKARVLNEVDRFQRLSAQYAAGREASAEHRAMVNQKEAERVVAEYFLREFDIKLV